MTSCACTGRTFAEVEARILRDGLSLAEAESLTGCGSICTACIPDLRSYLGRRARPLKSAPKE
jgi:bacterioferritin-associated ferredoxin